MHSPVPAREETQTATQLWRTLESPSQVPRPRRSSCRPLCASDHSATHPKASPSSQLLRVLPGLVHIQHEGQYHQQKNNVGHRKILSTPGTGAMLIRFKGHDVIYFNAYILRVSGSSSLLNAEPVLGLFLSLSLSPLSSFLFP